MIHPYNIYPWPDYFSGISLSLFFYFFLKKNSNYNFFLCSVFLFLAVFFRSTYLINILISIIAFSLFLYFFGKKNVYKNIFNSFFLLASIYFIILFYFDSLFELFNQSITFIRAYAGETKHINLYNKITSYVGAYGFIILKIFYYAFRSALNLFNISNFENLIFVFFIIVNFFYFLKIFKKKLNLNDEEKKFLFISILGLSGFVQAVMLMEIFRIINATIGIFLTGLFFFQYDKINLFTKKYSKVILLFIFVYGITLYSKFNIIEYDKKNYNSFNNLHFKNKKLDNETKAYYENLDNFICNQENTTFIINVTWDYSIPFLCKGKFETNKISMTRTFLKNLKKDEFTRIFIDNNLKKNELLFVELQDRQNFEKLKLIKIFKSFMTPKQWYGDIYVYKKL